jgi:hypothetical protein
MDEFVEQSPELLLGQDTRWLHAFADAPEFDQAHGIAFPEPSSESAVFITNFAFYYGNDEEPSPTGMCSFFASLKPKVSLLGDPMIDDLMHCLLHYAEVPRQI